LNDDFVKASIAEGCITCSSVMLPSLCTLKLSTT
jgi:hypothetical protein